MAANNTSPYSSHRECAQQFFPTEHSNEKVFEDNPSTFDTQSDETIHFQLDSQFPHPATHSLKFLQTGELSRSRISSEDSSYTPNAISHMQPIDVIRRARSTGDNLFETNVRQKQK